MITNQDSSTGLPIIRPLVLLNQTDGNTFGVEHAYCFGNEFLVAPMLAPNATQRDVYLPAGNWLDFWDNTRHAGGQIITWTNVNQAQFPLLVREGAIIPMLLDDVRTLCDANYVNDPTVTTTDGSWLVQVYPGGAATFTVFDGSRLQSQGTGSAGTVMVTSAPRRLTLRILGDQPATVLLNGTALSPLVPGPGAASPTGWRFDPAAGFIEVAIEHPGGISTVEYR